MTRKDIGAGSIFGIEIRLDYSWVIVVGIIAWSFIFVILPDAYPSLSTASIISVGLISTILFFVSLLMHELAHSLYARKHGIKVKRIRLFVFGGVSEIESEAKTPRIEMTMAILGPLTSLALCIDFLFLSIFGSIIDVNEIAATGTLLSSINLILAIFNLIPAFPLDGGRVLKGIVWKKTGNVNKATQIAAKSGKAFSYILIGAGLLEVLVTASLGGFWLIFIGIFLNASASLALQQSNAKLMLDQIRISQLMHSDFVTVPIQTTVKDFIENFALKHRTSTFIVADGNEVVGTIDSKDIKDTNESDSIYKFIHKSSRVVGPNEKAIDCFDEIHKARLIAIVNDGKIIGVVSDNDIQTYISGKRAWKKLNR